MKPERIAQNVSGEPACGTCGNTCRDPAPPGARFGNLQEGSCTLTVHHHGRGVSESQRFCASCKKIMMDVLANFGFAIKG